jgi:protein-L-isoaspartate(D-aspartate) O-methyltransferase
VLSERANRQQMLEEIQRLGMSDERVIRAIGEVDRKLFVLPEWREEAYEDRPLPIGYEQTISQPYTAAKMCELLVELGKDKKVLEIGTGSGWQTGILAKLFKEVYSVEIVPELAERAGNMFRKLKIYNVKFIIGDGKKGWPEFAPYDAIICGADANSIPDAWIDQLAVGGRVVCPVRGEMIRGIKEEKDMKWEKFGEYSFVPLV